MREAKVLDKYLVVEGFKNVEIGDVDGLLNLIGSRLKPSYVQILDAEMIAGFEHIYFAVLNALKAFEAGINISKNLAIEILLFASGQDQIKRAIEVLGVKPSSRKIAVVIVSDSRERALSALSVISGIIRGETDHSVIDLNEEKVPAIIEAFRISREEIESSMRGSIESAIKNILIERAAILVTQR